MIFLSGFLKTFFMGHAKKRVIAMKNFLPPLDFYAPVESLQHCYIASVVFLILMLCA